MENDVLVSLNQLSVYRNDEELRQPNERREITTAGYAMEISSNQSKILVKSIKRRPSTSISNNQS